MSRLRSASPGRWFRVDPALPHLPSLVRASRIYRHRPRSVARRAELLLRVLALRAPEGLTSATLGPLCALAQVDWLRPPEQFQGQTVRDLVDHLVRAVRYPLPEGLYALVLGAQPWYGPWHALRDDAGVAVQLLRLLGTGGSMEDACRQGLLPELTRTERHALWKAEPQPTMRTLLLSARVAAAGGPVWLAQALSNARVEADAAMLRWFVERTAEIGAGDVGLVVDWVQNVPKRLVPWSGQRVLREMREWHEQRRQPVPAVLPPLGPLPRSPFHDASWDEGEVRWEMVEIRSGQGLYEEGRALHHCVATYHAAAATGRISLWSLRCQGQRALTVEILHAERSIVQARGLQNRRATRLEQQALEQWASRNGVVIRPGVFA